VNKQKLKYYMHDEPTAFRFELAGNLNREGAYQLEQAWRTASSVIGDRRFIVDLTFLNAADELGRALINRWHREGARLVAKTNASRALAESILGGPLLEPAVYAGPMAASHGTWHPFHVSFLARAVALLLFAAIVFPVEANARALRPRTIAAWDDYVRVENANLPDRVRPGSGCSFPELEATALSPEIPTAARLVVHPIAWRHRATRQRTEAAHSRLSAAAVSAGFSVTAR
jgi:hypothetical protein